MRSMTASENDLVELCLKQAALYDEMNGGPNSGERTDLEISDDLDDVEDGINQGVERIKAERFKPVPVSGRFTLSSGIAL